MNYQTHYIQKIEILKAELDELTPFSQENLTRLQKKIRLEFNYNSNHLEGNTLTYGQTQLLLFYDKSSGDVSVSDIEEMKAHDLALSQIKEMAEETERPLTELFIKELNKIILVKSFWKDAISPNGTPTKKKIEIGKYKSSPNSVLLRNGEIHEYATPEETPAMMRDLLTWYDKNKTELHPVHLAALFHYKFVCIHPFDDGNGRVARLLMNFILLQNDFPVVIIKSKDKENYLTALQKADTGDILSLIEYVEKQAIDSLSLSIKAGKGESIEEQDDITKQIELLKREKLSKPQIYKTPKICFELINYIRNNIWDILNQNLNQFNEFFSETSVDVYVNEIKHRETKTTSKSPFPFIGDKKTTIYRYKIYDTDLEEIAIDNITWIQNMFSLKTATKKVDYSIRLSLFLEESFYTLRITGINSTYFHQHSGYKELFQIENKYNTILTADIIQLIIRDVSKYLISVIEIEK